MIFCTVLVYLIFFVSPFPEHRIAGFTTDFVNKVIENCQNGNYSGGLEEITKIFCNANLAITTTNTSSTSSSMGGGDGGGTGFSPH